MIDNQALIATLSRVKAVSQLRVSHDCGAAFPLLRRPDFFGSI